MEKFNSKKRKKIQINAKKLLKKFPIHHLNMRFSLISLDGKRVLRYINGIVTNEFLCKENGYGKK